MTRGFGVATLTWLLTLVMVPFLLAHETQARAVTVASAGTYLVGSLICHQRPDRSFRPWGVQMPVCTRCVGLYLGAAVGVVLAGARKTRSSTGGETARIGRPALRTMVLVAAVPTGVTWLGEVVGWLSVTGGVRAVAAVPLGVAVTWVASLVIRGELA
ncbi:MAG: DUF2085 domain-containing protein [Vicinamibacterales bacterium]|jgi:uncharacterized membrane protein|nr:DUF2085 domain-containing protein [Vicinamibacterales bacterium]|tara:strand:+ start:41 stop:514 length:474 start_codon:yes stop_codon:yes gene_type:complete